ncbi:MAG: site-specific integrase [Bacteroidia bacterium]|nr:site-specific integrase [Bacteroidia bacterium]
MRTANSFGLIFYPKTQKQKDGFAPLVVRITANSIRKEISLKHRIPVARWNKNKEIVSGPDLETKALNNYIAEVRTELHNCYRKMQIDKLPISAEAIKKMFLGVDDDAEKEKTLLEIVAYHNENMNNHLMPGTAKNYYTTQKYVAEFLKDKLKVDDIKLSQLNFKFLMDYDMFLRNHVPGENQKPCSNNTVMKHIERLRKIISMAVRFEWLESDPFMKFQPKFVKKDRGYLTEAELYIIENKNIHNASLRTVRDLFIFACYTGLAFSDAYELTSNNITKGIDGEDWIIIERKKTNVQAQIPILPKAHEIIELYKNHPKAVANGTLLPMLTNQRFNSYLKEIADICDINKNLTHHLARHTFATTVCLLNGISMEATSGMLGHASMRTKQIYGKVLPKRISNEMAMLKAKINPGNKTTVLTVAN